MAWKIFLGVFGALVAFALVVLLFLAAGAHESQRQAAAAVKAFNEQSRHLLAEERARTAMNKRWQAEMQERARRARMLRPDERCIGGTVVHVSGPSYTQAAGVDGRPVRCRTLSGSPASMFGRSV